MEQLRSKKERQSQSQVQEQTDRLESHLTVLHDSIGKLTDRLFPVLRSPVLPVLLEKEIEAKEDKIEVELVELASTIKYSRKSVNHAMCMVEDIIYRLEL